MSSARPLLLATLLLGACGFSETKFNAKALPLMCEQRADCTGTFDSDACIDEIRATNRSSCDYDPAAARDCFSALEDAACVDNGDLGTYSLEIPTPCTEVYPDCAPLYEEPYPMVVE